MTSLLVINPNTSESVTALLRDQAVACAPRGGTVHAVTARFGASYIVSELSAAVAAHAVLDAYAVHVAEHGEPGAVLIGCFGDPGLHALRELAPMPVLGLAEASMRAAAALGRHAIVTGGTHWPPMLRRLAWSLGLLEPLVDIVAVDRSGAELAADPAAALVLLRQACQQAIDEHQPSALVLGGAALAGMAGALAPGLPVPVFCSVLCGLQSAWASACGPTAAASIAPPTVRWVGMGDAWAGALGARNP